MQLTTEQIEFLKRTANREEEIDLRIYGALDGYHAEDAYSAGRADGARILANQLLGMLNIE